MKPRSADGGKGSGGAAKFKEKFCKEFRKKLDECRKKVFGPDASSVPAQTLNNAPRINATLSHSFWHVQNGQGE